MLVARELPRFRDEEDVVMTLLAARFALPDDPDIGRIGDATPTSFNEGEDTETDRLPYVRVSRVGGAPRAGDEHTDRPVIDIDVFALTRREAKDLAQSIEQYLLTKPHPVDHANVLMSPQRVEWVDGSKIRRFYASYHMGLRRAG